MNTTIIKENDPTSYVEQRKVRVAEITRRHSQNLFGYPHASIGEIRTEAVKRRLESIFNK